jgi:hypothetical protein
MDFIGGGLCLTAAAVGSGINDPPSAKRDQGRFITKGTTRHEGHDGTRDVARSRCALCGAFVFVVTNQPTVDLIAGFAGKAASRQLKRRGARVRSKKATKPLRNRASEEAEKAG